MPEIPFGWSFIISFFVMLLIIAAVVGVVFILVQFRVPRLNFGGLIAGVLCAAALTVTIIVRLSEHYFVSLR